MFKIVFFLLETTSFVSWFDTKSQQISSIRKFNISISPTSFRMNYLSV